MDYHPSYETGVDAQLRIVALLSSADPSQESIELACLRENKVGCGHETAATCIFGFPEAFYQGKITCQRLLDVIVYPCLKLARRINEEARVPVYRLSDDRKRIRCLMEGYHRLWAGAMMGLGTFASKQKNPSLLLRGKHAELLQVFLNLETPVVSNVC